MGPSDHLAQGTSVGVLWVSCGASAGLWSLMLARDLPSADGPHLEPCICPGAGKGLSFWNILLFNTMGTFSSHRGGHCHGPTRPPEDHPFPVVSQPGTILRALRSPAMCPAVADTKAWPGVRFLPSMARGHTGS